MQTAFRCQSARRVNSGGDVSVDVRRRLAITDIIGVPRRMDDDETSLLRYVMLTERNVRQFDLSGLSQFGDKPMLISTGNFENDRVVDP